MIKLREIFTVTALSSLMTIGLSSKAEATSIFRGPWSNNQCHILGDPDCLVDPPPGTFFQGQITIRFNRDKVSINDFGWFGQLSAQPQTSPPDTGDGFFSNPNVPLDFLEPNPQLTVTNCFLRDGVPITVDNNGEIISSGCDFIFTGEEVDNLIPSLILPGEEIPSFFVPQSEDDIFLVNFNAGSEGLQITTDENFNFFGFNYEFNQDAFEDKVVGIKLVPIGTGDLGFVSGAEFNTVTCIPIDSPSDSNFPTATCGQQNPPSDIQFITQSEILAASQQPGFIFDDATNEGFLSGGEPFQVLDGAFIPHERVNEPHNNLGLLALGLFGANLAFKRRRKQQRSS